MLVTEAKKEIERLHNLNMQLEHEEAILIEAYAELRKPHNEALEKLQEEFKKKRKKSRAKQDVNNEEIKKLSQCIIDNLKIFSEGTEFRTQAGEALVLRRLSLEINREGTEEVYYHIGDRKTSHVSSWYTKDRLQKALTEEHWQVATKNDFKYTSGVIFVHVVPAKSSTDVTHEYIGFTAKGNAIVFNTSNKLNLAYLPNKDNPERRKYKLVGKYSWKTLNKVAKKNEGRMSNHDRRVDNYVKISRVVDHKHQEELVEFLL